MSSVYIGFKDLFWIQKTYFSVFICFDNYIILYYIIFEHGVRLARPKLVLQLLDRPNHIAYGGSQFKVKGSEMAVFDMKKFKIVT